MAVRVAILSLRKVIGLRVNSRLPGVARRALFTTSTRKYYHDSPPWRDTVTNSSRPTPDHPIPTAVARSSTTLSDDATPNNEEPNNTAYLGEADSDDHFEADVEINPEAHRHKIEDASVSGLHGQSGEGDEPLERERKPQDAIDAAQASYLGEADSDDAHEADREINPEKYRHLINDARTSGMHGESGEGDEPMERR